jgi:putative ABC transport system permease protein
MIGTELIIYSLKNLWNRKMRSFLTIFSILIGIATIFLFISFGLGLFNYVDELTSGSSADKLLIQPRGFGAPGLDPTFAFSEEEIEIVRKTPGVKEASGAKMRVANVENHEENKFTFIMGYDPDEPLILDMFDVEIDNGRNLKSGDVGKAVFGYNYQIDGRIFEKGMKVGDKVEIQGVEIKAVGFFESIGSPPDDAQIYFDEDFMDELFPGEVVNYGMIVARVDIDKLDKTAEKIEEELRDYRDQEEGKEDFYVQSFAALVESFSSALDIIIGFIIFIAFVSVIVSAVNTANTMITSVLERVKEIGVMKAIGAKNSEIFNIFLFESFFLGFVAGLLGSFVGWVLASGIGSVLNSLGWGFLTPAYSGATAVLFDFLRKFGLSFLPELPVGFFRGDLFLFCLVFASITGAISGAFPARQASKTVVVDALRYE